MPIEKQVQEEKPAPLMDDSFRKPSLDFGSLLDRRQFEQNLIKFGIFARLDSLEARPIAITTETTVVQTVVSPSYDDSCYWKKVNEDICYEDGEVYIRYGLRFWNGDGNYVGLVGPDSIVDYELTLPGSAAGAKKHLFSGATNVLDWGQNVDSDGSPSFVRGTFTQADGISPFVITSTTLCSNLNADFLDGNHSSAFEPALGNPAADGYVLSSTMAGVRSWITLFVSALNDLTDVVITSPTTGDILRYDGSNWVNYSGNEYRYYADLADDAIFTLPFSITSSARGFIAIGDNEERTDFWIDNDGDVILINNSTNVVANADTDNKFCIGTAAAQEPLQIKNRLGSTKKIFLTAWYN